MGSMAVKVGTTCLILGAASMVVFGSLKPVGWLAGEAKESVIGWFLELAPPSVVIEIGEQKIELAKAETGKLVWGIRQVQDVIRKDEEQVQTQQERTRRLSRALELLELRKGSLQPGQTTRIGGREMTHDGLQQEADLLREQLKKQPHQERSLTDRISMRREHVRLLHKELGQRRDRIGVLEVGQAELKREVDRAEITRETNGILKHDSAMASAEGFQAKVKNQLSRDAVIHREINGDETLDQTPAAAALLAAEER